MTEPKKPVITMPMHHVNPKIIKIEHKRTSSNRKGWATVYTPETTGMIDQ